MRPRALIVFLLAIVSPALASSRRPRPLKRIDHPATQFELHPLPFTHGRRSPTSRPTRLTVRTFGETYHLHLVPNEQLLHPQARINYYSPDGKIVRSEPLTQHDLGIRVYEGVVVKPEATARRWKEDGIGGVLERRGIRREADELGWARITVRGEGEMFEGAFHLRGTGAFHIKSTDNYLRHRDPEEPLPDYASDNSHIVVFRDIDRHDLSAQDLSASHRTCSHDSLAHNTDPTLNPVINRNTYVEDTPWYDPRVTELSPAESVDLDARYVSGHERVKRQNNDISGGGNIGTNFINNIGSHDGCPTTQSIVYVGVAADCRFVQTYGGAPNATTQILNDFNSATALYKSTFDVSLGIIELAVMDPTCPANETASTTSTPWNVDCLSTVTLNDRLSLFSAWRGAKGADGAGLWHLMSGCPTGTEVGVAWLGTLCQTDTSQSSGQSVSGTAVTTATQTEWQVIAHETGHNFGAIHDCGDGCTLTGQCCPATTTTCSTPQVYVMDPVTYVGENTFSDCSIGNICTSLKSMNTSCLRPADGTVATISLQMCGNGIVEAGEDCDPGKGVTSPCCDSTTCKFTNSAVCDPKSSGCCTDSCQFAPSTQVCRPARDANCDIVEMCTGTSGACPADLTQPNGKSCGSNGLACASGQCTSPSQQCRTVGASMNLTKACPQAGDKSCQVSCQDPTTSNQCILLQASLIDGSPCGYGGSCKNMSCQAGSFGKMVSSWYRQNLQIAIPVTIAAALVIILLFWRILQACCASSRRRKAMRAQGGRAGLVKLNSWGAPPPDAQGSYPAPPGAPPQPPAYEYPPQTSNNLGYNYTPPGTSYPPHHADDDDFGGGARRDADAYSDPFGDGHAGAGGYGGGQYRR